HVSLCPTHFMLSIARDIQLTQPVAQVWGNLADLDAFARQMPGLSAIEASQDCVASRISVGFGPWNVSGAMKLKVVESRAPGLLRVRGTISLDPDGGEDVAFDVTWVVARQGDGCRVTYVARLRTKPALETLAKMACARGTSTLERRVRAALSRNARSRSAA
ncbi:MAG: SRPBCC family protein, partial [Myxococcota bacterium]